MMNVMKKTFWSRGKKNKGVWERGDILNKVVRESLTKRWHLSKDFKRRSGVSHVAIGENIPGIGIVGRRLQVNRR